jgi:PBP1b-binding outer membrane lipoprotein LpoB
MSTIRCGEGHNVRVTSHRRARTALLAALLAPALLLSACGGESKQKPNVQGSTDLPRGRVEVPDGITLTKAGTALKFGEPAVVAYEPNTQRSSVLSVTVSSVQAGRIADFAAYQLDERTRK